MQSLRECTNRSIVFLPTASGSWLATWCVRDISIQKQTTTELCPQNVPETRCPLPILSHESHCASATRAYSFGLEWPGLHKRNMVYLILIVFVLEKGSLKKTTDPAHTGTVLDVGERHGWVSRSCPIGSPGESTKHSILCKKCIQPYLTDIICEE